MVGAEVDDHQQRFSVGVAQVGVHALGVVAGVLGGQRALQLVETALPDGLPLARQREQAHVELVQLLLLGAEAAAVELAAVQPFLVLGHAPVIENGRAAVLAREALGAAARLAHVLPKIQHHGARAQRGRHRHGR